MTYLVGVDIGTSATKAIVVDAQGAVVSVASAEHDIDRPHPGWTEQSPADWWRACCAAVRSAVAGANLSETPERIVGVGLSGQMHGSVFLGNGSTPESPDVVRPAILWNDQRTVRECALIEERAGGSTELIRAVGNPALTGMTAPKILWLKSNEPANYERVEWIILPKDYVSYCMTGVIATDVGDASGTLLFDPRTRDWHDGLIGALGLERDHFPRACESQDVVGELTHHAASELGLVAGTPVVAGSGDQMTGAIGAGVVREGIVSATLGTSGVVFAHVGATVPDTVDGTVQIMCAAVPGEYCVYGCMLAAAGALHWYRDTFCAGVDFDELVDEATSVPAGAGGLYFLPYISGERCPYPDPDVRGSFVGFDAGHRRAHASRAVLEGVAHGMGGMLELVRSLGIDPKEVRMSGGGARSELWRTIHAAVFRAAVTTMNTQEGSAFGAAILAGVGTSVWPSVQEACGVCLREETRIEPDDQLSAVYGASQRRFDGLYQMLQPHFHGTS